MRIKLFISFLLCLVAILLDISNFKKLKIKKEGYTSFYTGSSFASLFIMLILIIFIFNIKYLILFIIFTLIIIFVWLLEFSTFSIIFRFNDQHIETEYSDGEIKTYDYNQISSVSRYSSKNSFRSILLIKFINPDTNEEKEIRLKYGNRNTKLLLKKLVEKNVITNHKPSFFGKFDMCNQNNNIK